MGKKETWSEARDRRRERRVIRRDERRLRREGLPPTQPTLHSVTESSSRVSDADVSEDRSSQVIGMGNGSRRGVNRLAFLAWSNPDAYQETPEERNALDAQRPLDERLQDVYGPKDDVPPRELTPSELLRAQLQNRAPAPFYGDQDK